MHRKVWQRTQPHARNALDQEPDMLSIEVDTREDDDPDDAL